MATTYFIRKINYKPEKGGTKYYVTVKFNGRLGSPERIGREFKKIESAENLIHRRERNSEYSLYQIEYPNELSKR